jgi:hypothetical protein
MLAGVVEFGLDFNLIAIYEYINKNGRWCINGKNMAIFIKTLIAK